MADLMKLSVEDVERIRESVDLTEDRIHGDGFDVTDDTLEALKEFCDLLLSGGDVNSFLSNQDMVVPES